MQVEIENILGAAKHCLSEDNIFLKITEEQEKSPAALMWLRDRYAQNNGIINALDRKIKELKESKNVAPNAD